MSAGRDVWSVLREVRKDLILESGGKTDIFIHFDSLIAYALLHDSVISSPDSHTTYVGLPFLQLAYLAEAFLHRFLERGLRFRLLHFRDHRAIWSSCPQILAFRHFLLRHFLSLSSSTEKNCIVPLHTFESISDPQFETFLITESPYVILTSWDDSDRLRVLSDERSRLWNFAVLDLFLCECVVRVPAADVVTISSIEFSSSSVSGFVWSVSRTPLIVQAKFRRCLGMLRHECRDLLELGKPNHVRRSDVVFGSVKKMTKLDVFREVLRRVGKRKVEEEGVTGPELERFVALSQVFLQSLVLLEHLSLRQRCIDVRRLFAVDYASEVPEIVGEVRLFVEDVFSVLIQCGIESFPEQVLVASETSETSEMHEGGEEQEQEEEGEGETTQSTPSPETSESESESKWSWLDLVDCRLFLCCWRLFLGGNIPIWDSDSIVAEEGIFTSFLPRGSLVGDVLRKFHSSLPPVSPVSPVVVVDSEEEGEVCAVVSPRRKLLFPVVHPLLQAATPRFCGETINELSPMTEADRIQIRALNLVVKRFEEKYHWSVMQELAVFEQKTQSVGRQRAYRKKIESLDRYAKSLNRKQRTIAPVGDLIPERRGRKKKTKTTRRRRRNKHGRRGRSQSQTSGRKKARIDQISGEWNWKIDFGVLEAALKTINAADVDLDRLNGSIEKLIELYVWRDRPLESVLIRSLLKRAKMIRTVADHESKILFVEENDVESAKWSVFHACLLTRQFLEKRAARPAREESIDLRDCPNQAAFVSAIEVYEQHFPDSRVNAVVDDHLSGFVGLDLADTSCGILYQLKTRESLETIAEAKEYEELTQYWNSEMFERYKKSFGFIPDAWQIDLMHSIDANESVVVVAPTSSGKTFLTFYLMQKVLESTDDGVVVFVSPTVALVNQMVAEIQSRFRKRFPRGKTLVGMFTSFDRIKPLNCQILVTVAQCFQHLLLSPNQDAIDWRTRIRYVVFDEVHTINSFDVGTASSWEMILHLCKAPFLALSATVGNPESFVNWLNSPREPADEVKLIYQNERPVDLRFFSFIPSISAEEEDEEGPFGATEEEGADFFNDDAIGSVHPFAFVRPDASLELIEKDIRNAKQMTPTQLLEIFAMLSEVDVGLVEGLDPKTFFREYAGGLIPKHVVRRYEARIRVSFLALAALDRDEFRSVVESLRSRFVLAGPFLGKCYTLKDVVFRLAMKLKETDCLPAIFFHFSRRGIESLSGRLAFALRGTKKSLYKSERAYRHAMQSIDSAIARLKKLGEGSIGDRDYRNLRAGIAVHHGGVSTHFRLEIERLFRERVIPILFATGTLAHGVNMPCKTCVVFGDSIYLTSSLFNQTTGRAGRRGLDTGGRVVLYGMTSSRCQKLLMNADECIVGRIGIGCSFVLRLMILLQQSSSSGRGRGRQHRGLRSSSSLEDAIRILSNPLASISRDSRISRQSILHMFRFSIEFLLQQGYIGLDGKPINFAGLASHLFFKEPSNFLFLLFLRKQLFHQLYDFIAENQREVGVGVESDDKTKHYFKRALLKLCCFFFSERERSPSIRNEDLVFPPLSRLLIREGVSVDQSAVLSDCLDEYYGFVSRVLKTYLRHVGTVWSARTPTTEGASQTAGLWGSLDQDDTLPLSGLRLPSPYVVVLHLDKGEEMASDFIQASASAGCLAELKTCSLFAGLSGHCDEMLNDAIVIVNTLRSDIELFPSLLPLPTTLSSRRLLSSYIWDFYCTPKAQHVADMHGMSVQDLTTDLSRFLKVLNKIKVSLTLLSPVGEVRLGQRTVLQSRDIVVRTLVELADDFRDKLYPRTEKKRTYRDFVRRRRRIRDARDDIGDLSLLGGANVGRALDEFFKKTKGGRRRK